MRILHLLNHTNRMNGHVHVAVDLSCAQIKSGHSVAVASGGGDFDALLALLDPSVVLRGDRDLWR